MNKSVILHKKEECEIKALHATNENSPIRVYEYFN